MAYIVEQNLLFVHKIPNRVSQRICLDNIANFKGWYIGKTFSHYNLMYLYFIYTQGDLYPKSFILIYRIIRQAHVHPINVNLC